MSRPRTTLFAVVIVSAFGTATFLHLGYLGSGILFAVVIAIPALGGE